MIDRICSKRGFLKRFALLSCLAMTLSAMTIGCPSPYDNALPSVIGIYSIDAAMNRVDLRGDQNVPVHTQIVFVFSGAMNTADINFLNSSNIAIPFTMVWDDDRTLTLTPIADLSFDMDYIIGVSHAVDTLGNPLNFYANPSAKFRTVGS